MWMPIESSSIFSSDLVLEQSFVYWKESDEDHFWESVYYMQILCHKKFYIDVLSDCIYIIHNDHLLKQTA